MTKHVEVNQEGKTHMEHIKANPPRKHCAGHHINIGGDCFNCQWIQSKIIERNE